MEELKRGVDLFKTGSTELRLAISKSLRSRDKLLDEVWAACGDEDFEARHYLVGMVINNEDSVMQKNIIEWLLTKAHPSYASALLLHLDNSWYQIDKKEPDMFIPFLKQLYRQSGKLILPKPVMIFLRKEEGSSIQKYVIKLIPHTLAGRDLLAEWMINDGKKLDKEALDEIWEKCWRMMKDKNLNDDFWNSFLERSEIAEAWCLSHKEVFYLGVQELAGFKKNCWRQIFNPDPIVRNGVLEYFLTLPAEFWPEDLELIRNYSAPKSMKIKIKIQIDNIYSVILKENDDYRINNVQARYPKLIEALNAPQNVDAKSTD